MRPRAIQSVPELDPQGTPFERLEQFARMIVRVPKTEANKEIGRSVLSRRSVKTKGSKMATLKSKKKDVPIVKALGSTPSGTLAVQVADEDGNHGIGIWNLSVLIVPDEQFWFAQGLEINYGAQGDTKEDAQKNFQAGLLATICLHLKVHGNITKLLKFAPDAILQEAAKNKSKIKRFAQVSFHEIANAETQDALPFDGIDYRVLEQAA